MEGGRQAGLNLALPNPPDVLQSEELCEYPEVPPVSEMWVQGSHYFITVVNSLD